MIDSCSRFVWPAGVALVVASAAFARSASADEACAPTYAPSAPETAQAKDEKARSALAAKRYPEAATLFRAVATEHPTDDRALPAAMLSVEALRIAGESNPRCFEALALDVPRYRALFCAPGSKDRAAECSLLGKLARDLRRLDAQRLVEAADKDRSGGARKTYLAAADEYLDTWNTFSKEPCRAGRKDECAGSEELLFNAGRAFKAAHALSQALAVQSMIVDPANGLAQTNLGRTTLFMLGETWLAIGEYARAAPLLERFAETSPKELEAIGALHDATALRLALGESEQAQKNLATMQRNYGAKAPTDVAAVARGIADYLEQNGQWPELEKLTSQTSVFGKEQPARFLGEAMLGTALAMQGKKSQADKALRRIADARPTNVVSPHDGRDGPDFDLAEVVNAIGDAKLHFADQMRGDAMALTIRKGSVDALTKKEAAVEKAEKAYREIDALQPFPPPHAMVAGAGRVAAMRSQLWGH